MSQVAIARNGMKNCDVKGIARTRQMPEIARNLRAICSSAIENAKAKRHTRKALCKSVLRHVLRRRASNVSLGSSENDIVVRSFAFEAAFTILAYHFLRADGGGIGV